MPPVSASDAEEIDVFNCFAEHVDGAIDAVVVVPGQKVVGCSAAASFG